MTIRQAAHYFLHNQDVHFDVDDPEWGRVASDGRIVELWPDTCLVNAYSIRADILIKTSELHEITS